ncbi:RIP metalloprotease RseP [Marinilabiliaceae bacterium JC040]|nr:RIP metalloprotease RseP [Marinilabiliaceae bacterium JC040]
MSVIIKIIQLILSLSLLVIIHELGHFTFAKLFKTRVEKFYLFFNPRFSLFKKKWKGTEYGIGWIPLGGYVKISGMIDESMDKKQLENTPKDYEFRSKPAWQRLLIMLGGIINNFILAYIIYICVLFVWGDEYLDIKNIKHGFVYSQTAKDAGFKNGDLIYAIDNKKVKRFSHIAKDIIINNAKTLQIIRNGENINFEIPSDFIQKLNEESSSSYKFTPPFYPRVLFSPLVVDNFPKNSKIKEAGAKIGDIIIAVNNKEFKYLDEYAEIVKSNLKKEISIKALRNKDTVEYKMKLGETPMLGFIHKPIENFKLTNQKYSFKESIPLGIAKANSSLSTYLKGLKLLFQPETKAYKSVGSFITIGNIFPSSWDWRSFWEITALISIMLGIMNLLPIPALDGGHVLFLLIEIIIRRKPSQKLMERAQILGMLILFSLMFLALSNDIIKLFN